MINGAINQNCDERKYIFRYKGTKYFVKESRIPVEELKGFRVKRNGKILLAISNDLEKNIKQRELHRLITGRGLRALW